MTAHPARQRTRLLGTLGLALSAILSPSGKIISSAVASSLLVGGLVTHLRPPTPPALQAPASKPVAPAGLAHSRSSTPRIIYDIEVNGQRLPVVLTADAAGGDSSAMGHGHASASPALGLPGGSGHMPNAGSPRVDPSHGLPALPGPRPGAPAAAPPDGSPPAGNPPSATPVPPVSPTAPPDSSPPHPTPRGKCTASPDDASPREVRPGPTPPAGCDDPADHNDPNDPAGHNNPREAGAPATTPQGEMPSTPPEPSPGNAPALPGAGAQPDPILLAGPSDPAGNEIPGNTPAGAGTPSMPQGGPLDDLILEPIRQGAQNPSDEGNSQPGQGPANLDTVPAALPADPPGSLPLGAQASPQILQSGAAAVPEPSTIGLMLLGVAALAWTGRARPAGARRA